MLIKSTVKKSSGRFLKYGLWWSPFATPAMIELDMIKHGGTWTHNGQTVGNGLFFHFRKFQEVVWPSRIWENGPFKNHWAEKCLEMWLDYTYIGAMGCAASGKSDSFGINGLTDWYAHTDCTTMLVSSTDLPSLDLRIWGMVKKYHKLARENHDWIPGHLIEGRRVIINDAQDQFIEGRDFKNGIIAVPCKRGNSFVGLGSYVGIHNKRVFLIADECNLMPRAFLDSAANLAKCQFFRLVGLGNPNETTNAHGFLCEPAGELGGWEGGVDQKPGTKIWRTKFPNGACLQLPGSDSPNMKAQDGEPPPFPFLMTRKQMVDDGKIWGVDDWHFKMMDEAMMPRGQGSRRVLTRQMCEKFGAFLPAEWRDSRRTRIAFLDAAYRGVGGDRCIFGELQFGPEAEALGKDDPINIVIQDRNVPAIRNIIHLVDTVIVPINGDKDADPAEDQIVQFVMRECEHRGITPNNFFFDAGMRTSLVTSFSRLWTPQVNSIDCGGKPSESMVSMEIQKPACEYYSKFITELWYSVRLTVESGQFRGMTEEACTEFSQREWKMVSGNRIEVESKDEMKQKTGHSPDIADAIAIGLHGARSRGFLIVRANPPKDKSPNKKDWRDDLRQRARSLKQSGNLAYN